MADAQDSKSCEGDFVWVQVPPAALKNGLEAIASGLFIYKLLLKNTEVVYSNKVV